MELELVLGLALAVVVVVALPSGAVVLVVVKAVLEQNGRRFLEVDAHSDTSHIAVVVVPS